MSGKTRRREAEHPLIAYIQSATELYAFYKSGGFHMGTNYGEQLKHYRQQWELMAAIYRVERRTKAKA